jgi:hypothetical protein
MAKEENFKILGQSNPNANTDTNLYLVPASTQSVCSSLNVCNTASVDATFRIAAVPSGESLSKEHYLAYDSSVSGNDTLSLILGVTLGAGDVVKVYSSSNDLSFSVFGSEIE